MSRVKTTTDGGKIFKCPGCGGYHSLPVAKNPDPDKTVWGYNGNAEKPTFTPSIKATSNRGGKPNICHSQVADGKISFCGDCTHELINKTVDIPEWPHAPGTFGGVVD